MTLKTPSNLKDDLKRIIREVNKESSLEGEAYYTIKDLANGIKKGFLAGQQSEADRIKGIIEDRLKKVEKESQTAQGENYWITQGQIDELQELLAQINNSPQDKTEHEKGLLNEVSPLSDKSVKPTDRMPEVLEVKNEHTGFVPSGSPTQNQNICANCGKRKDEHYYRSADGKVLYCNKYYTGEPNPEFTQKNVAEGGK